VLSPVVGPLWRRASKAPRSDEAVTLVRAAADNTKGPAARAAPPDGVGWGLEHIATDGPAERMACGRRQAEHRDVAVNELVDMAGVYCTPLKAD
jgi:hypothetical protein